MSAKPPAIHTALHLPFTLTSHQLEAFDRDGCLHIRGVFAPEILAHYSPCISQLAFALNPNRGRPMDTRGTYEKAFIQVVNLWRRSAQAHELVSSQRLARIAADLLGVNGVRLYHDQALYKEPGGGITPWHADQYYWPVETDRCVTAWIPLQATPLSMGPLAFAAGSHRYLEGRGLPISDDSERMLAQTMGSTQFPLLQQPFALGDISFHLGWTYHRAGANTTATPRKVMTVIYMDSTMRLATPANADQEADRQTFCPDTQVGEVIDGPLTPILWSRDHA